MTIFVIVFLLTHSILDGKLQFTLNLPEEIINEYVIILLVQLILNSHQFKSLFQFLWFLKQIKRIENADKCWLTTFEFGPKKITDPKYY